MPTPAPALRDRVTFARRIATTDEYGATSGAWQDQFTVAARVWARLGGDVVLASRLEGVQPVVITVRQSDQTRQITPDWKAVNARTGVEYSVQSVVDPDMHNADHGKFLDVLSQTGVAA